jgi:trypsin
MGRRSRLLLGGILACLALLAPAAASADVQPKVVGGSNASISQYPWQAAVLRNGSLWCGGSLITTRIVITAGHCVVGQTASTFSVALGRTTLSNTSEGTTIPVQALSYRSNYSEVSGAPRYDVGYLVLASPSSQTKIQIAGGTEGSLWSPGVTETVTGWGCTSPPKVFGCSASDTLQAAQVPIVSDSTCAGDYGSLFDPTTQVCAGYQQGGIDTCNGDSGGPLEAPLGGGAYRLVGLTSWGDGCAKAGKPGVYTRVAGPVLRPLVGGDICNLETQYGFAHETVIAGATSADDPCLAPVSTPPATPTATGTTTVTQPSTQTAAVRARRKCKKIQNRVKRRRCLRKTKHI